MEDAYIVTSYLPFYLIQVCCMLMGDNLFLLQQQICFGTVENIDHDGWQNNAMVMSSAVQYIDQIFTDDITIIIRFRE